MDKLQGLLRDYKQLIDAKQNEKFAGTQELARGLLNNLDKHIPSSDEMKDPQAMMDYGFSMNPASGLVGSIVNPTKFEKGVAEWLRAKGVSEDSIKNGIGLNSAISKYDIPGTVVNDPSGRMQGPQFQSDDMAAHIMRVIRGVGDMTRSLGLKPEEQKDIITSTLTHDAGKLEVPLHVAQRTKPPRDNPDINFPDKVDKVPTFQEITQMPDSVYKDYMTKFHNSNPGDLEFMPWGNFTKNDLTAMQNHNQDSLQVGKRFGFDENNITDAMYHHTHFNGSPASYPKFLTNTGEEIPAAGRIASIVDSFDAIATPRYGLLNPDMNYEKALEMLKSYRGQSTGGTQYDPNLLEHFEKSGLAQHYYDNIANKTGDDLSGIFQLK